MQALDLALSLRRQRTFDLDCERFLLADSSPGARFDWLWAVVREIRKGDLVSTVQAMRKLTTAIQEKKGAPLGTATPGRRPNRFSRGHQT